MSSQLFSDEVYRKIKSLREIKKPFVPEASVGIHLQKPKSREAVDVNKILVQIFNDEKLHEAVAEYGKTIPFAPYKEDGYYLGYSHLILHPKKRMLLARTEPKWDSDYETETKDYQLFEAEGGIYYVSVKNQCAILTANEIRGFDFEPLPPPKTVLTARQILDSLENTLKSLK